MVTMTMQADQSKVCLGCLRLLASGHELHALSNCTITSATTTTPAPIKRAAATAELICSCARSLFLANACHVKILMPSKLHLRVSLFLKSRHSHRERVSQERRD